MVNKNTYKRMALNKFLGCSGSSSAFLLASEYSSVAFDSTTGILYYASYQQQQGTFDESVTSHSGLYSEPHHTNTVNYTIATDSERRANAPSDSVTMATDYKKAQTVSTTSVTIYPAVSRCVVNSSTCDADKPSTMDDFTSRGGFKSATLVNIAVSK